MPTHRLHRFPWLCLCIACGPSPADTPNAQVDGDGNSYPRLPDLDAAITEEMAAARVPGLSACLVRGEETIWCNGYGYADIDSGRLVNRTTPFILASISKTFIAEAAMQLVEDSLLDLDAPVTDTLDFNVIHPRDDTPITARMLLSHTAGVRDNWPVLESLRVDGDSPLALGNFMEGYLAEDGEWYSRTRNFIRAGVAERSVYSNVGAALAAYVVERASQVPFDRYCEDKIFEPLGMHYTAWHLSDMDEETLAVPYEWRWGEWEPYEHYGYPDYPDVNLRTGAEQLSRFLSMHAGGGSYQGTQIVSDASVEEMNTAQYPDLDPEQGLIWYSWKLDGETYHGHNGSDYGSSTEMGVRSDGLGFVILMNSEGDGSILPSIERAMIEAAEGL